MYIKKEGSCRISIEKKIRFFIKKRRYFPLQKKKVERKKKDKRRKCTLRVKLSKRNYRSQPPRKIVKLHFGMIFAGKHI